MYATAAPSLNTQSLTLKAQDGSVSTQDILAYFLNIWRKWRIVVHLFIKSILQIDLLLQIPAKLPSLFSNLFVCISAAGLKGSCS